MLPKSSSKFHDYNEIMRIRVKFPNRWKDKCVSFQHLVLTFGVPVLLYMILIFVLGIAYVIQPYINTSNFTQTICRVKRVELKSFSGSCSFGSDVFHPCVKVFVVYTAGWNKLESVVMENEQALTACDQCSYTFGRSGFLHKKQGDCEDWKESFNASSCLAHFLAEYGSLNSSYTCYFNPITPTQVIKEFAADFSSAVRLVTWPFLFCVLYGVAGAFAIYRHKQIRMLNSASSKRRDGEKIRRLAARQSLDQRKRRLSVALGVVSTDRRLRFSEQRQQSRRFSLSLQDIPDGDPSSQSTAESVQDLPLTLGGDSCSDMRHLDLAVSERNVDALTRILECRGVQSDRGSIPALNHAPHLRHDASYVAAGSQAVCADSRSNPSIGMFRGVSFDEHGHVITRCVPSYNDAHRQRRGTTAISRNCTSESFV